MAGLNLILVVPFKTCNWKKESGQKELINADSLINPVESASIRAARRPLVLFGGAIGDHLLLIPALRALDRLFPGRLELVSLPRRWHAYYRDIKFRATYENFLGWDGEKYIFDADNLIREAPDCDLVISFNSWYSPEMFHFLQTVQPANSLGYYSGYTTKALFDQEKHAIDMSFDLIKFIDSGLQPEDFGYAPCLAEQHCQKARELRAALPAGTKVLVVHADTKPEKMWESGKFVKLLNLFLARHPEFVVIVVGQEDLGLCSGLHSDRIYSRLQLPQLTALALVGEADLFVGVDSCMLHAADLYGIPGVSLFGPTSPTQWGFRFSRHHFDLQGKNRKLENLTPWQVLEALEVVEAEVVALTKFNC
jgi:ADP-heptose:LPS heptosyltransferase